MSRNADIIEITFTVTAPADEIPEAADSNLDHEFWDKVDMLGEDMEMAVKDAIRRSRLGREITLRYDATDSF